MAPDTQSARSMSATRGRAAPPRLLPWLSLIALAQLALLLRLLPTDTLTMERLRQRTKDWRAARGEASVRRNDPALGTRLPTAALPPEAVAALKPDTRYPRSLLVFVSACTGCNADTLLGWRDAAKAHHLRVVLISRDSPENIRRFVASVGYPLPIIADTTGAASRAANTFWFPRAFLIDNDRHLLWEQTQHGQEITNVVRTIDTIAKK